MPLYAALPSSQGSEESTSRANLKIHNMPLFTRMTCHHLPTLNPLHYQTQSSPPLLLSSAPSLTSLSWSFLNLFGSGFFPLLALLIARSEEMKYREVDSFNLYFSSFSFDWKVLSPASFLIKKKKKPFSTRRPKKCVYFSLFFCYFPHIESNFFNYPKIPKKSIVGITK